VFLLLCQKLQRIKRSRFGSIGKQYFDDAGDPLISGKLHFYESGTTTPKNTYSDASLTIANSNPVILTAAGRQPNIFFGGTAKVILTKSDNTQIEVRDPEGIDQSGGFDAWDEFRVFDSSEVVIGSDGKYYVSQISNNQGNDPVTVGTSYWDESEFIRVWKSPITYAQSVIVKYTDGKLYRSKSNGNQGNVPNTATAFWESLYASVGSHMITARQGNGYGSTNTKRRKYSVIEANIGTAATYVNDAALGFQITIVEPGLYEFIRRDHRAAGSAYFGISKNSAQLTTNIDSITQTDVVCAAGSGTEGNEVTRTILCAQGDVIGPHDMGSMDSTSGFTSMFSCRKVSNV